jgi:VirE-like protein
MSVLSKLVSYYPSKNATSKGVEVNLLSLLQSDKHKDIIQKLRCSDAEAQKRLKDELPCFTVAGTFSRRCEEGLKQLSGLAAVDLDSTEKHDKIYLLDKLKENPCIAYAGLSCRGNRLWAIVPFLFPDKYEKHYERLIQSFIDMGLPIGDECHKQISQPRFVSWNDATTQFFNHYATKYHLLPTEKTFHAFSQPVKKIAHAPAPENAFEWCVTQVNKSYEFVKDKRHPYIMQLARYCNIKGLPEQETLNGCLGFAQPDFDEKEITDIVKHIYTTQSNSHNKIPYTEKKTSEQTLVANTEEKTDRKLIEGSWLGTDGKFYIPNPVSVDNIAVYDTPEAYNKRLHIPHYISREEAEKLFFKPMAVYLDTLQTIVSD